MLVCLFISYNCGGEKISTNQNLLFWACEDNDVVRGNNKGGGGWVLYRSIKWSMEITELDVLFGVFSQHSKLKMKDIS